jgi:restriction system protein
MSVPGYESFMLPALRLLADGHARKRSVLSDAAADALGVFTDDRALMLPSGKTPVYRSRAGVDLLETSGARKHNHQGCL